MSGLLELLIAQGTRADQIAVGQDGQLYYVTDEGVLEHGNGSGWDSWLLSASGIEYTPLDLNDWDCLADPGDVSDAIDQLAARVNDLEGGGPSVTYSAYLIEEKTPSGVGTVTFSSIPQTYRHLLLRVALRSTTAAANVNGNIQFNGDTTATNYRWIEQGVYGSGTGFSNAGDTYQFTTGISAASAPSNSFTVGHINIPYYRNANNTKHLNWRLAHRRDASSLHELNYVGVMEWENTSAITQIVVALSSGNFTANSILSLYGLNDIAP